MSTGMEELDPLARQGLASAAHSNKTWYRLYLPGTQHFIKKINKSLNALFGRAKF